MTLFVNDMSYDSGNFDIPYEYAPDQREKVLQKLSDVEERIVRATGESIFEAKWSSVSLVINPSSIFVSGSLSKLLRADNITPLAFSEVNIMYEFLSDLLEIPINTVLEGNLWSIDFTGDMKMLYRPNQYFEELGPYNHVSMKRIANVNSLYYKNSNQKLLFYDKLRQAKSKGYIIPTFLQGKHVLRYERKMFLKTLKSICKEKSLGKPRLSLLQNKQFYNELIREWKQGYYNIEKEASSIIDFTLIETPKDMDNIFKSQGIEHLGGVKSVMEMVDKGLKIAPLKRSEYNSRIRKSIRKINSNSAVFKISPLIEELSEKVNEKEKEFLAEL